MALPSGYTKLEYIESTGTQWIDTGVTPNQNTEVYMEAQPKSAADAGDGTGFIPYGAAVSYNNNAFECYTQNGKYEFNYGTQNAFLGTAAVGDNVVITHKKSTTVKVNGTESGQSFSNTTFTAPYTLGLFGTHRATVLHGLCKISVCKIYDNGTLVRDYIPCKNASGVVGMWDDVNSQFYTNAGTGAFTAGPEVKPDLTAHKTLVGGTAYTVQGGKCMVGGTVYNILKGRTLIDGTGWDITFPSAVVMPAKGDLITMNLDGTDRLYRVLKIVDGTTVEVVLINSGLTSAWDSNSRDSYGICTLDSYLNGTWYNTLSASARAAIVPKQFYLYQYTYNSSAYSSTHPSYADYSSKSLKSAILYERNIYVLDIEDIEEYFGGTAGSVSLKTPGKFSGDDLRTFFWDQVSPGFVYAWLRSIRGNVQGSAAWAVAGFYKEISTLRVTASYIACPAFQIDLSKIDFTIGGA